MVTTRMDRIRGLLSVAAFAVAGACLPGNLQAQSGPVLYWPMDEGTGTTVADESGNSSDGTVQGAAAWTEGRVDAGIDLTDSSTGDYIIKASPASFPTTAISTSFWVRTTDSGDALTSYATGTYHDGNMWLIMNSANVSVFRGQNSLPSGKAINDGVWHHVVVTWQNTDGMCQLYVDGRRVWQYAMPNSIGTSIASGGTLVVGQEQDSVGGGFEAYQSFEGDLDEYRIYDRVLSAAEVQDLYAADLGAHLMVRYPADEGSGTTAGDSSGNGNDASLQGSVGWSTGKFGTALDFTATGMADYAIKNPVEVFPATAITTTFWIKTTDGDGSNIPGIISYAATSGCNDWTIVHSQTLCVHTGNSYVNSGVAITDGNWHHVGITWQSSDGQTKIYIDGDLVKTDTMEAGHCIPGGGSLVLGQEQDTIGGGFAEYQAFEGELEDVRIYSYVLSREQVRDTMAIGGSGPANFVYGMWNWDQTVLGDNERIEEMVQFCLDLGITEIGFTLNWNEPFVENPNNIPALEDMLERLHDNGIKVEMLAGNSNWIYHHDQGPLQGKPVGGEGYDFGVKLIERFIDYQDERYVSNPGQCFDGIRLDIEPHGLRSVVYNSDLTDPNDPRRVEGGDDAVAISGFDTEPYLFIEWDPTYNNGYQGGEALPAGGFVETSVTERNEIMLRFWEALKRYKAQLQDDRGEGHITHNAQAVAQYLQMSTDQVPWYWTIGVQDEDGFPLIDGNGDPVSGNPGHAMVDHDDNPSTPDIEVFKAVLYVPDKVALMGYRDRYYHYNGGDVFWHRSVRYWNEGFNIDLAAGYDPDGNPLDTGLADQFANARGVLPYLDSINKPTSVGLEFIAESALGFHSEYVTYQGDPYEQIKNTIVQVADDLETRYPAIRGIRYHEYYEPLPGKPAEAGQTFDTFWTWVQNELYTSDNLADWQAFHNATANQTPNLPALETVPVVSDPDALTLTLEGGSNEFKPGPGKSGYIKATINGLPTGTSADDFYIVAHVKVLGDTNYFQGGHGITEDIGSLLKEDNGAVDASGFFHVAPIRIGDISVAKIVWWLDLYNANGHFIRRFVLDPNDPEDPTLQADRYYDPNDPLNIDVQGLLPTPIDLTFSGITVSDVQKVGGTISGYVSGFPDGTNIPSEYHVRTWVQLLQDGIDAGLPSEDFPNDTDPNWRAEQNGWSVLACDVEIEEDGYFEATNDRPINPTGDSDSYGETNGTYKIQISVHTNGDDGMARLGFPTAESPNDGMKPTISRYLDMDFSIVDSMDGDEAVSAGVDHFDAGYEVGAHFIGVDSLSGKISGNVKGLSPTGTYYVRAWIEFHEYDRNIWHIRCPVVAIADNDTGYFELPVNVTQLIPSVPAGDGITVASPRNVWISVHDDTMDLNQFPEISATDGNPEGSNPPDVTVDNDDWMGRFFHMDDSFVYYEGFRPDADTSVPTSVPAQATSLAASAIDSSSIELSWSHSSSSTNEEVGFKIERLTGTDPFAEIAKIHGGDLTTFSYEDTGLSSSTTYVYRVTAFNDTGNSSVSDTATETTLPAGPPSLSSVTCVTGGMGGRVEGRILNMPSGDYNVRTWVKSDIYYKQGVDTTPEADGNFNAPHLWASSGSQVYVTLHPDADDPWGSGDATNISTGNWPTSLGSNAVVFGPFTVP